MVSVFSAEDQLLGLWTPWPQFRPFPVDILLRGRLRTLDSHSQLSPLFTSLLTADSIILLEDDLPIQGLHVQWKTLLSESVVPNSFALKAGSGELVTLVTETDGERRAWVRWLTGVAICSSENETYQQIRELGHSRSSSSYLCRRKRDGRLFTVKRVEKELLQQPPALVALINEISIQRTLSHPNIVALWEVHEAQNHVSMVRDFCAYGDIYKWITAHKHFSLSSAARITKHVLEALAFVHSKGILHRDIKLENILITGEDTCKLSDFGLAVRLEKFEPACCGSPGYVAPEVLKHVPYGTPADVFSLGVVLFVLLSGRSPFTGKTSKEILKQNKLAAPHFREKDWENVPRLAVDLVQRMLIPDPNKRITAQRALEHHWILHHGDGPLGLLEMPSPSPKSMQSPPNTEVLTFESAGKQAKPQGRRHSTNDALSATNPITPGKEETVEFTGRRCSMMNPE